MKGPCCGFVDVRRFDHCTVLAPCATRTGDRHRHESPAAVKHFRIAGNLCFLNIGLHKAIGNPKSTTRCTNCGRWVSHSYNNRRVHTHVCTYVYLFFFCHAFVYSVDARQSCLLRTFRCFSRLGGTQNPSERGSPCSKPDHLSPACYCLSSIVIYVYLFIYMYMYIHTHTYIYMYMHIYVQGVPGGMCQTSGGYSLC